MTKNKRELIINSCLELVMQNRTYKNISIQNIASNANIGKGTIYEYFKSKEELLVSTLDFFVNSRFVSNLYVDNFEDLSFEDSFKLQMHKMFDTFLRHDPFVDLFLNNDIYNLELKDKQKLFSIICRIRLEFSKLFTLIFQKGIDERIIKNDIKVEDVTIIKAIITGSINEFKFDKGLNVESNEIIDIDKYVQRVYEIVLIILN